MTSPLARLVACGFVLALGAWGLHVRTGLEASDASGDGLSLERARSLQDRSHALLGQGREDEALPLLQQLHDAFPDNPIYLRELAEIHDARGEWQTEVGLWERYLELSPTPWDACPKLGDAYRKLGKQAESIRAFERCLATQPRDPDLIFYLAHAYERAGRFLEARTTYRRGLEVAPDYPDLQLGLARMEVFIGDPARAQGLAESVLRKRPASAEALLVLGMALRSRHRLDEAAAVLRRGLAISPDSVDLLTVLGGVAEQLDRRAEAIACYRRALRQEPGSEALKKRLDRLGGTR